MFHQGRLLRPRRRRGSCPPARARRRLGGRAGGRVCGRAGVRVGGRAGSAAAVRSGARASVRAVGAALQTREWHPAGRAVWWTPRVARPHVGDIFLASGLRVWRGGGRDAVRGGASPRNGGGRAVAATTSVRIAVFWPGAAADVGCGAVGRLSSGDRATRPVAAVTVCPPCGWGGKPCGSRRVGKGHEWSRCSWAN